MDGRVRIVMHFGDERIEGVLGDSETARAFAALLPVRVRVSGTGIDFCGAAPFELPYEKSQVGFGWTNGDINYNPDGGWFAVLFDGEQDSRRYGDQVNIGRVTSPLERLHALSGAYEVLVERVSDREDREDRALGEGTQ